MLENMNEIEASDLERSFSVPIPEFEIEDKTIGPLTLERQPFSELINITKHPNNY
jgi:hypothetical protein